MSTFEEAGTTASIDHIETINQTFDAVNFMLRWSPPIESNATNWTYAIYYGRTIDEFNEGTFRMDN